MENVVSARRLRKSMLKNLDYNSINTYDKIGMISRSNSIRRGYKTETLSLPNKIKFNFKTKLIFKIFVATLIIFVTLICKLTIKDIILQNQKTRMVVEEYRKDWSKESITNSFESTISNFYSKIKYIIPDSMKVKLVNLYYNNVKPSYISFNLNDVAKKIFEKSEVSLPAQDTPKTEENPVVTEENNESSENNGVGGAEPIEEDLYEESVSAISSMNEDVEAIKAKNISMVAPTVGTITSMYGARDEIFEGVNSYHTGTDIANKKGTEIKSCTTGKVVSVVHDNKYYGNFVEVETEGVIFKYAHMDSINVTLNSNINQGDIVGFMGSTGMSTGPHLHLEIKIDSRTVDPQELISL